jgi:hypothetical protein
MIQIKMSISILTCKTLNEHRAKEDYSDGGAWGTTLLGVFEIRQKSERAWWRYLSQMICF